MMPLREGFAVCPAGQRAIRRFSSEEAGMQIGIYWSSAWPMLLDEVAMHNMRVTTHLVWPGLIE